MKHHAYDFVPGLVLVAALAAPTGASAGMMGAEPEASAASSRSVATFRTAMRKLWEEHIEYTRNYIISGLAGLEDASAAAERLLRNQDDIGDAIKPFYGEAAGKKLSALLRDHIVIAADIVSAARSGNSSGVSQGEKKWHENADEIAAFLAGANSNWSKTELTEMLYGHLDFTTAEVVSRLKKDWAADITAYDKGHAHMMMFADLLSEGVAKQFPEKFVS